MKLYALHDTKAKALSSFHVAKSDAQASRDFAQAVLDPKGVLGKYPDDFELVSLADVFEDVLEDTLQVTALPMEVVVTAKQVVDLQPKAGAQGDPAQLALLKEA